MCKLKRKMKSTSLFNPNLGVVIDIKIKEGGCINTVILLFPWSIK